jgi:glycosyltransferase involved in cell wall biosynthesis
MKIPPLSIITITKDDPQGLADTVASAAVFRAAGAEHLVIDGSADPAAAARVVGASRDPVALHPRPARGVADAFNAGIAQARGEWLWFLNGGDRIDDRLAPEFLLTLLRNSKADVIVGGVTYDGETDLRPHFPSAQQWPPLASWIPHPSTLVRKTLFDRFGPFDERYRIAMDYEWWLRALGRETRVDVLAVPFSRFAPGGISQRPESRLLISSEKGDAIRRHQAGLWKNWISRGGRLGVEWIRALFAPRI